MKKTSLLSALFILALVTLNTACSGGGKGGTIPGGNDVASYSQEVGPDGGTVTDPRGAVIIIPPGALDAKTTITVRTYAGMTDVKNKFGSSIFQSGVELLPHSLQFKKPVTVTMPSGIKMTPGDRRAVFLYDSPKNRWNESEIEATVNADGSTLTFTTTHFCYLMSPNFASIIQSNFLYYFRNNGYDADATLNAFVPWFVTVSQCMDEPLEEGDDYVKTVKYIEFQVDSSRTAAGVTVDSQADMSYGDPQYRDMNQCIVIGRYFDTMANIGGDDTQFIFDLKIMVYFTTEDVPEKHIDIEITYPRPGETLTSPEEEIGTASVIVGDDDTEVTKVEFFVDGSVVGTVTGSPFRYTLTTTGLSTGTHVLKVRAYDGLGHTDDSPEVSVKVDNSTPAGASFTDTDFYRGKLGGDIVVNKAPDETGISNYVLYWGNTSGERLAGNGQIAVLPCINSDITYTLPSDTELPDGAKYILVYIDNGTDIKNTPAKCSPKDLWEDRVLKYNSSGTYTGCSATVYDEYGTKTEERTYNTSGVKQGYTLFMHDEYGNLRKKEKYDSSGTLTAYWVYDYFNNIPSLLTKEGLYNADGSIKTEEYTRNYDSAHNLLFEKYIFSSDTSQSYRDVYTYDASNRVLTVYTYDGSEAEIGHSTWVYSAGGAYTCNGYANGYLNTVIVFDGTTAVTTTYDAGGYYIGETVSVYNGSLVISSDVYLISSDHEKVMIKMDGKDIASSTRYDYTYQNNREIRSTMKEIVWREYYDSDGNVIGWAPVWNTANVSTHTYNSSGICTAYDWRSYDSYGVMKEGWSYTYDDAGRCTSDTKYGVNGVVTESKTYSYESQFYPDGRVKQMDYSENSVFTSRSIYQYGDM